MIDKLLVNYLGLDLEFKISNVRVINQDDSSHLCEIQLQLHVENINDALLLQDIILDYTNCPVPGFYANKVKYYGFITDIGIKIVNTGRNSLYAEYYNYGLQYKDLQEIINNTTIILHTDSKINLFI